LYVGVGVVGISYRAETQKNVTKRGLTDNLSDSLLGQITSRMRADSKTIVVCFLLFYLVKDFLQ